MKKGWKHIIAAGIILAGSFLYAHTDKCIPVFDRMADNAVYGNMGTMTEGVVVQQEFSCEKPVLDGVSIKCSTYGLDLTSVYRYQIIDPSANEVLREGTIDAAKVKNGKYYKISFERVEDCKDQNLIFRIAAEDAAEGNALTIFNMPKQEGEGTLTLNGAELRESTLALKTVSHVFDLETFASVVFCLAYLYVFVLILYKFFT